jgi:hypothetical protein
MPLRYGTPFRKAFSDPEVFSAFVRDVIGVEFEFTRIEQEKGFPAPVGKVDIRFDLYGEDLEHRAIVELHHAAKPRRLRGFTPVTSWRKLNRSPATKATSPNALSIQSLY